MFSVFGKAMETGGGEYGVAILSKYPFVYINNKPFEGIDGAKEPRTLLYVDIQQPGTSNVIRIGTTHLDHSTDLIRSAMAEQINERIGTGDTPTLLGGDFNARTDSNVICEVMKTGRESAMIHSPIRQISRQSRLIIYSGFHRISGR
ncbi:endonuclease/exonuclease/phosphatase family protein [Bacteroides sp. CR5/BHMF/2]|nr:endonuclease/exonuclease/phosphatase family protein [Bacteroides sp. CR5/BHMF/2]